MKESMEMIGGAEAKEAVPQGVAVNTTSPKEVIEHEDPYERHQKMRDLKNKIEEHLEILKAVERSKTIYGNQDFVTTDTDGIEVTSELLEQEKAQAQMFKTQEKQLHQNTGAGILKGLRKIRHLFWML